MKRLFYLMILLSLLLFPVSYGVGLYDAIFFYLSLSFFVFIPGALIFNLLDYKKCEFYLGVFLITGLGLVFFGILSYVSLIMNTAHALLLPIYVLFVFCLTAIPRFLFDVKNIGVPKLDLTLSSCDFYFISLVFCIVFLSLSYSSLSGRVIEGNLVFYRSSGPDELARLVYTVSLKEGIFPPENFLFARHSLSYHYLFYLMAAVLLKVTGLPILDIFYRLFPLLFSVLVPCGVYGLVSYLFDKKVGVFTVFLLFLSGNIGFFSDLLSFDSKPQSLWVSNFGGGAILPLSSSFHVSLGLYFFLLFFYLFIQSLNDAKHGTLFLFLSGTVLGISSLIHFVTFVVGEGTLFFFLFLNMLVKFLSRLKHLLSPGFVRTFVVSLIFLVLTCPFFVPRIVSFFLPDAVTKERLYLPGMVSIFRSYAIFFIVAFLVVVYSLRKTVLLGGVRTDSSVKKALTVFLFSLILTYALIPSFISELGEKTKMSNKSFDVVRTLGLVFPSISGKETTRTTGYPYYIIEVDLFHYLFSSYQGLGFDPNRLYYVIYSNSLLFFVYAFGAILLFLVGNYFLKSIFTFLYLTKNFRFTYLSRPHNMLLFSMLFFSLLFSSLFKITTGGYIMDVYFLFSISVFAGLYLSSIKFKTRTTGILLIFLLAFSLLTTVQSFFWWKTDPEPTALPVEEIVAVKWLRDHTSASDLVVVSYNNVIVPVMAGRKTLLSMPYFLSVMGNDLSREVDFIDNLYSGNLSNLDYFEDIKVSYVYIGKFEMEKYGTDVSKKMDRYVFTKKVYDEKGVSIYEVT